MAPVRESIYFPPLDKCLDGRHELFSWKTTYIGLKELEYNPGDESLERHLTDSQTLDLLKRSFTPDLEPTSEARSTFNTKTSAINTVPSTQGRFDINQIKDDSLWLSTEAKLNEVAALRIVVLERQTRPAEHLQHSSLADDRSIALGAGSLNGSRSQPTFSVSRSALLPQPTSNESLPSEAFDSDVARRARLIKIYLAERRYRLKTCKYLVITALCTVGDGKGASSGRFSSTPKWVDSIGNDILSAWDIKGVSQYGGRNIFLSGIDSLRARIRGLEEGSNLFRDQGVQESVEAAWCENQIIEIVAILETMLVMLGNLTQMSRSGVVSSWFRLMSDYGFFEIFEPPFRGLYDIRELQLQSLSSLVSIAILRIPYALYGIESLSASASSEGESAGSAPYLLNPDACSEISEILVNAASECLRVASPAVLAWSIILQGLREQAFIARETRETRQSIHAAERFRITASPDVDHTDQTSSRSSGSSLRRLSSTGSDAPQTTFIEQLLDQVLLIEVDGDPVAYLARAAVDGSGVLNVIATLSTNFCTPFGSDHRGKWGLKMRHVLMDLVKASLTLVDYQPDLIETTLAVLSGSENYWQLLGRPREFREAEPAAVFLEDDTFMNRLFYEAQSRFPYETLPFLKLSRALAVCFADQGEEGIPALWPKLAMTNSFTSVLPLSFAAYRLTEDDDDSSFIQLTASLETFQSESATAQPSYKRLKQSNSLVTAESVNLRWIPEGTKGLVLSETKPLVVRWYHEYSPLAYLGILLNSALMRDSMTGDSPQSNSPSPDAVTEIIDLLSLLLLTTSKGELLRTSYFIALDMAQSILDNASEGLNRGQDIISVIFDIFEQELGRQPQGTDGASLAILNRCIQFAQALLHTMPDRVWPFLGRSALLGIKDGDSQLSVVLASTEIPMAKYDFLVGCIHLYESLIDDAASHAVSRKTPTRPKGRYDSSQLQSTGVSQTVMKKVLLSFQRILLDVYESIPAWKFVQTDQKLEINSRLSTIFIQVLTCCFGIEDLSDPDEKLGGSLIPAAEHTINVFLATSGTEITQDYFVSMLNEGVAQALSVESLNTSYWIQQTISALRLVTSLLRLNTLLEYPQSNLEVQMLKSVSLLARCYTSYPSFRQPVVELLQVLVHNADRVDGQPASLLGHMGEDTASQFLEGLLTIDEPLCSKELSPFIWKLLSDVASKRQQWFAISVLTGETPRKLVRKPLSESGSSTRGGSLLSVALDGLSNIGRLPLRTASAMLEFVVLAADSWPWILATAEQHPYFLTAITEYIGQVETVSNTTQNRSNQAGMEYYKIQLTSHITEVLAMYTHYSLQNGKRSYAKDLLPNLGYVSKAAITSPNYNASLQSNLRQNFEAKFRDCRLTTFKRTPLRPAVLGDSFYFDMETMNHFLKLDPSWQGRNRDGFIAEIARANVNLSVVEAQISLFHSWKYLAVELTKSLADDADYQKVMVDVVTDCLRTNTQNTLPQAIFERLAQSRADLAFTLLQSLVKSRSSRPEIKSVLFTAWDAMRAHGSDLTTVLDNDHAAYARTLLKILCLSIQAHATSYPSQGAATQEPIQNDDSRAKPTAANATLFTVLEILKIIVANGFRSLTALLHDAQSPRVLPSDFALLSAILRTSLLIPGIDRHTTALLSTFADAQTSRYAATLLSWSDQLATNRDPIYGELSINFLLEMSGMPALAESLAVEGILNHICNTNLIKFLRSSNKGIGPFDQPARLYNIWVRGILPLLLNLLHAVGASMAAEIAANLNQFSNQIARASSMFTFDNSSSSSATVPAVSGSTTQGYITLSMISEAQTLAIITSVLDTYRRAGASAGVVSAEIGEVKWERGRMREDVEMWLQQKGALRERLVPVGEREEGWGRMDAVKDGEVGNRLEERAVEEMGVLMMLLAEREE